MGIIEDTIERERIQTAIAAAKQLVALEAGIAKAKADPTIKPGVEEREKQRDQLRAVIDALQDTAITPVQQAKEQILAAVDSRKVRAQAIAELKADPDVDNILLAEVTGVVADKQTD